DISFDCSSDVCSSDLFSCSITDIHLKNKIGVPVVHLIVYFSSSFTCEELTSGCVACSGKGGKGNSVCGTPPPSAPPFTNSSYVVLFEKGRLPRISSKSAWNKISFSKSFSAILISPS